MKIRTVGAELLYVDIRTDGMRDRYGEANSRILQFCECF